MFEKMSETKGNFKISFYIYATLKQINYCNVLKILSSGEKKLYASIEAKQKGTSLSFGTTAYT